MLRFDAWPPADQSMWTNLTQDGGPLDGQGRFFHLRDASREVLVAHYGKWLRWIGQSQPELLGSVPEDRVTPERLDAFLRARRTYAAYSKLIIIDAIARIIQAHAPERDWTSVRQIRNHLARLAKRSTSTRKQGRILSSQVLFERALEHATQAPAGRETPLARATRCRNAALIAFLAMMPARARAVAELRLGSSVQVTPTAIWILLSETMTKNGQPWEASVPAMLSPLLNDYLEAARPWLLGQRNLRHDVLWVNDRGKPFSSHYLSVRVSQITERLTGVPIPVHFFRDAAATTLARQSPADAKLIRPLLGHLNFETADRHYVQAQGIEAGRDLAAALGALKAGR